MDKPVLQEPFVCLLVEIFNRDHSQVLLTNPICRCFCTTAKYHDKFNKGLPVQGWHIYVVDGVDDIESDMKVE